VSEYWKPLGLILFWLISVPTAFTLYEVEKRNGPSTLATVCKWVGVIWFAVLLLMLFGGTHGRR
jgi:hypothetical protein